MDMLVNLYNFNENIKNLSDEIFIKKALSPDRYKIIKFVKDNFGDNWASECESAFSNNPITCFVAIRHKKVVGFACYDVTCKNFFGPMGVLENFREKGIGTILLKKSLLAMKESGYAYAIIGSVGPAKFYEKKANATLIESSKYNKNIYSRMIEVEN